MNPSDWVAAVVSCFVLGAAIQSFALAARSRK